MGLQPSVPLCSRLGCKILNADLFAGFPRRIGVPSKNLLLGQKDAGRPRYVDALSPADTKHL
eukprot:13592039-Alexandrium_andersonii.AAC.1